MWNRTPFSVWTHTTNYKCRENKCILKHSLHQFSLYWPYWLTDISLELNFAYSSRNNFALHSSWIFSSLQKNLCSKRIMMIDFEMPWIPSRLRYHTQITENLKRYKIQCNKITKQNLIWQVFAPLIQKLTKSLKTVPCSIYTVHFEVWSYFTTDSQSVSQ
jgi:hypothetical protein